MSTSAAQASAFYREVLRVVDAVPAHRGFEVVALDLPDTVEENLSAREGC